MSNEAERGFIGGILHKSELLQDYDLKESDFIGINNKQVFLSILEMGENGDFIDPATFLDYLSKKYQGDDTIFNHAVGIIADFISFAGMSQYAGAIKRDSQGLQLSVLLRDLSEMAGEHGDYSDKIEKVLDALTNLQEPEQRGLVDIKTNLRNFMDEIERRGQIEGFDGIETGLKPLDDRFNGLKPSDLIVVAGRPSMGKTTLAMNIADKAAINNKSVLVFSLEMSASQLIEKSISSISNVELGVIKSGKLKDEDWPLFTMAFSQLQDKKYSIDETAKTVQRMSIVSKKKKIKDGLDLIVIDYLQLMEGVGRNRNEEVGSITRQLKQLAKELEVPIILLSQLSRGVESRPNKRPLMSDLRDSGSIEQDADVICFVYRDEYYYQDDPHNKGVAEIITAKFRNGEVGTDILSAQLSRSKFSNLTHLDYMPYETKKQTKGFN